MNPKPENKDGLRADLDEIVFAQRNKAYGAYALRKAYAKRTARAFASAVVLFAGLLSLPAAINALRDEALDVPVPTGVKGDRVVTIIDPPPIVEPPKPIQPPPTDLPQQIRTQQYVDNLQVVRNEEAKPEATIPDVGPGLNPGTQDQDGADTGVPTGDPDGTPATGPVDIGIEPEKIPSPTEFFAGQVPEALNMTDFRRAMGYPIVLKEMGVQGMVTLRILVGKDGAVLNHIVLASPHKLLTQEVEKHLALLKFKPGTQAGRAVPVWVTIPIRFQLDR